MTRRIPSRAIFFDRDGIVNKRVMGGYVTSPDEFVLLNEVLPLLNFARSHNYLSILISNQQGVGKGLMSDADLESVTKEMQYQIHTKFGWAFDDVYYATERSGEEPQRRKPSPAMLFEAATEWYIDLSASWMIGDTITDAEAGRAAGCRTILINHEADTPSTDAADYIVPDHDAALAILREFGG
ncbi:MAG: HAD-IIIA family hydrolase [Candidatus Kapabacteria bacterium]|nr:HAD-IIIA family hydrolase [Candidatus Kapabacteria bacterium]